MEVGLLLFQSDWFNDFSNMFVKSNSFNEQQNDLSSVVCIFARTFKIYMSLRCTLRYSTFDYVKQVKQVGVKQVGGKWYNIM